MLCSLAIQNLAIVDRLEAEIEGGFTVITGETGAGKSILINALHLLLGGRASEDSIRTGEDQAQVEGVFELAPTSPLLPRLQAAGLDEGRALRVRRQINKSGRNRIFINDHPTSLAQLAAFGRDLLDISGQHEHVRLTDEATHLEILDAFGGLGGLAGQVALSVAALRAAERELQDLERRERERAERQDYLRFSLERIDALDPRKGEDAELERERVRLSNAERLSEGLDQAVQWLYEGDGSAVELIGRAGHQLEALARFDPDLGPLAQQLEGSLRQVEDSARELQTAASGIAADPPRLEQIELRLQALRGLVKSFGPDLEAVLERRAAMTRELEELEVLESHKAALETARGERRETALALARELSGRRAEAGQSLAERLQRELRSLAMDSARVTVVVEPGPLETLSETGLDVVRFLFTANPGEDLRPLARVASGGELSRLLLALKSVLAEVDPVPTYVFDEVDSGIGGGTAEVIGEKLQVLAHHHQVLCITHLPQVAAFGETHYTVRKLQRGGRTLSEVERLPTAEQRVEELARMAGGRDVTEQARRLASDLLARAASRRGRAPRRR